MAAKHLHAARIQWETPRPTLSRRSRGGFVCRCQAMPFVSQRHQCVGKESELRISSVYATAAQNIGGVASV